MRRGCCPSRSPLRCTMNVDRPDEVRRLGSDRIHPRPLHEGTLRRSEEPVRTSTPTRHETGLVYLHCPNAPAIPDAVDHVAASRAVLQGGGQGVRRRRTLLRVIGVAAGRRSGERYFPTAQGDGPLCRPRVPRHPRASMTGRVENSHHLREPGRHHGPNPYTGSAMVRQTPVEPVAESPVAESTRFIHSARMDV